MDQSSCRLLHHTEWLSQNHICSIQLPICEFQSLNATSIGLSPIKAQILRHESRFHWKIPIEDNFMLNTELKPTIHHPHKHQI